MAWKGLVETGHPTFSVVLIQSVGPFLPVLNLVLQWVDEAVHESPVSEPDKSRLALHHITSCKRSIMQVCSLRRGLIA